MVSHEWEIRVANPSSYYRSDFVEIDLESIGVDSTIDENFFCLVDPIDGREIPYQIDHVLGNYSHLRVLTFFAENVPPGQDNYCEISSTYILKLRKHPSSSTVLRIKPVDIDYYYQHIDPSLGDNEKDGYNSSWYPDRKVLGLKMRNTIIELHFSLVANSYSISPVNYLGSVTSILLKKATVSDYSNPDNMLSPPHACPNKLWGKVTKLVFFTPPWQIDWYNEVFLRKDYELLYSNIGPLRSVITMKSEPFAICYKGAPLFDQGNIEITCNLYRIVSLFTDRPYYIEELFVLCDKGYPISFRPYFLSVLNFPPHACTKTARMENIPDYFAMWKYWLPQFHFGYGFASDSHVRQLEINDTSIQWRLQLNFCHKTVNYFMYNYNSNGFGDVKYDMYHEIGHNGWYEQIYKPLEVFPVTPFQRAKRYQSK